MKIRTLDLTRVYYIGPAEIAAVDSVSFEIDEGKFVAIIGPSGSGKSTLLNLVGLNDYPTSGKIYIDDSDASLMPIGERRKTRLLGIGFVFQAFNLLPTLNALENVELAMSLAGKSRKTQRARATHLLKAVGLGSRRLHRPKQMSMGEMQRVAIARALANDPELVLADEPTGELDSTTGKEIIALLLDVNRKEKKTVVVATHDEKMVDVADVIYTIRDGRLRLES